MEQVQRELEEIVGKERVFRNEPMERHTTFRVGGPADLYLTPSKEELPAVLAALAGHRVQRTVVGNGSNLLVSDRGIRGAVIEIGRQMAEASVEGEVIRAQAGALLSSVAGIACRAGLSGMEFAAGIPGSVGGAMVMNAGAYGGEMKDITEAVTVLAPDGSLLRLSAEEMAFAYRRSCIEENGYLALEAEFRLKRGEPDEIRRNMEELKERRLAKQPLNYPSAGSTFRRPKGYFAGKLIMEAGLAGYAVGGAEVSAKHCGFVINRDGASAADILAVIRHVQETVFAQSGVALQTEVKLLGEF